VFFQELVAGFDSVNFITELVEDVLENDSDKVKLSAGLGFLDGLILVAANFIDEIKLLFLVGLSISQDLTTLHNLGQESQFELKVGDVEVSLIIVSSNSLKHEISAGEEVTLHV
jgi:hypothetical protein